jgi:hypothetical protein
LLLIDFYNFFLIEYNVVSDLLRALQQTCRVSLFDNVRNMSLSPSGNESTEVQDSECSPYIDVRTEIVTTSGNTIKYTISSDEEDPYGDAEFSADEYILETSSGSSSSSDKTSSCGTATGVKTLSVRR